MILSLPYDSRRRCPEAPSGFHGRWLVSRSCSEPDQQPAGHVQRPTSPTSLPQSHNPCTGREIIDYLRWASPASLQATSISLPAAQQVLSAMDVISGRDGSERGQQKIQRLKNNSNTMRKQLQDFGLGVLGSEDSPVVVRFLSASGLIHSGGER